MYLFLDTETTAANPTSAEVCQFASIVTDAEGNTIDYGSHLISISGAMPEGAYNVHHISKDFANTFGTSMAWVIAKLEAFYTKWPTMKIVGHNAKYDVTILLRYLSDFEVTYRKKPTEAQKAALAALRLALETPICTMLLATPVCQLPGKRGFKWPKLSEAYFHFLGVELADAHNAFWDTLACQKIFFKMKEQGCINAI